MADALLKASTGSQQDDAAKDSHTARLEDGQRVKVPGTKRLQRIVVAGQSFVHVAEVDGEWVYRAL